MCDTVTIYTMSLVTQETDPGTDGDSDKRLGRVIICPPPILCFSINDTGVIYYTNTATGHSIPATFKENGCHTHLRENVQYKIQATATLI